MAEMDYLRQKWREYEEDDYENNNNEENKDEIELGLGLSLNGKFGVDPNAGKLKSLRRSYSISNLSTNPDDGSGFPWAGGSGSSPVPVPLSRTCSLPVETEDDCRRRKEIQMLRRREAKRRRFEKMRNGSGCDGQGVWIGPPPLSQGSSGSSEFDSQSYTPPVSGMNTSTEAKSPQSVQSLDQNEHKSVSSEHKPPKLDPMRSISASASASGTGEMVRNLLADMPCVSTKGDGPHGKRVDGFLYRYKKREEVRIVCVCHGNFLTPAEFIKHAGGGDVEHPLRHIVVNPSTFL